MHRSTTLLLLLILTLIAASPAADEASHNAATDAPKELVFLNWNEYVDPDVIKEFETKFNARVKNVYFGTEDETIELMIATGGKGYDVILVPGSSLASYARRKWLLPLDKEKLPNLSHVQPRWITGFDQSEADGSPYLWGTMGIVYRTDLAGEPPKSWKDIFVPREEWRHRIQMPEDAQELIGIALKSLGYPLNEEGSRAFKEAEALLQAQNPYVAGYTYADLSTESRLATGDVWLSMTYNGDALLLMENAGSEHLAFIVPEEGTMLWADYLAISAQSAEPELAHAFLNFMHEPENARRTAETLFFATTNETAEILLSKEHHNNPAIYPPKEVIERSEFLRQKKPRTMKRWNALFTRLDE